MLETARKEYVVSELLLFDQPLTPGILLQAPHLYRNYPTFQRNFRWTVKRRQLLIDSILRNYPIGSLLAVKDGSRYEIFDGKQRIETLYSFMADEFPTASALPDRIKPVMPKRLFSSLPQDMRDLFTQYRLRLMVWRREDLGDHAALVFRRLNDGGIPLTRAELLYTYESEANARADDLSQHPWIAAHTNESQRERRIDHLYALIVMMLHRPVVQAVDSPSVRVYARGDRARAADNIAEQTRAAERTLNALRPAIKGRHVGRIPELVVAVQAAQHVQRWGMRVPVDLWGWIERSITAYDTTNITTRMTHTRQRSRPSDDLDRPTPMQQFWLEHEPSLLEFVTKP